ncbi:MAG: NUDIX hydrolase [Conexivisphaerales archaeon]
MSEANPSVLDSEIVFNGRKLKIVRDSLSWGGGRKAAVETIVHPGAVAILAFTPDGRVILEKQYRHSVKGYIYEVPAGTLEPGEDPAQCASRELLEETGYRVVSLRKLGAIYPAPGYSSEILYLFTAKASKAGGQRLEDDEAITVSLHMPEEALRLVMEGGTFDGKSALLLQMALADPTLSG